MRRVALVFLAFTIPPPPSPASAQTTLSLAGGINFTSLATETGLAANYDAARKVFTGVAATVPIAGSFQVRLGASFSQKGNFYALDQIVPDDPNYPTFGTLEPYLDLHLNMGYVEFTALASLASPVSGGPVTVRVLAGPAIGLLASCKATGTEYEGGRPSRTMTVSCPDEAQIAALDLGLAGGAGLNVELTGRLGVVADLVYTHGLKDAGDVWVGSDPGDINRERDLSAKHRTLTLSAGLTYSIAGVFR